jgi:hypothetical protein
MFYKVLKIFQVQELYKKGGKGNIKGGGQKWHRKAENHNET